jgi:hypothetical protein
MPAMANPRCCLLRRAATSLSRQPHPRAKRFEHLIYHPPYQDAGKGSGACLFRERGMMMSPANCLAVLFLLCLGVLWLVLRTLSFLLPPTPGAGRTPRRRHAADVIPQGFGERSARLKSVSGVAW